MIRPHLPAQLAIFVAGLSIEITVAPARRAKCETIAGVIIPDTAVVKAATWNLQAMIRELQQQNERLRVENAERSEAAIKAQGAEQGEPAWYFVGRAPEREAISSWLTETNRGMLIVTGR